MGTVWVAGEWWTEMLVDGDVGGCGVVEREKGG